MKYFPITTRMSGYIERKREKVSDGILSISDYKPDYIEREPGICPHCAYDEPIRTNRYLYRCTNTGCGRYW